MNRYLYSAVSTLTLTLLCGCGQSPLKSHSTVNSPMMHSPNTRVSIPNELGYSKICLGEGELYKEGIVDPDGQEVLIPSSKILVSDITGQIALVQLERKFLFVPLEDGPFSIEELESVPGFQYAEPYRCGLALVMLSDSWFYISTSGQPAFDTQYEFAESFHNDRALVKHNDKYQIIDTLGKTVAAVDFDQVSPQSPWCWQVTQIQNESYRSGFIDLSGQLITELIYDDVGYYDSEVKRIRVGHNQRYGFLNEYAQPAIPVIYEYAEVFDHGKAKVMQDGRSFFIDPAGNEVP